jgi:hypothetical protein
LRIASHRNVSVFAQVHMQVQTIEEAMEAGHA